MMSSPDSGDWMGYLTWDKGEAEELASLCARMRDHDASQKVVGYEALDEETYYAVLEVTVNVLGTGDRSIWLILTLAVDEKTLALVWRLQAMTLSFPTQLKLVDSLNALKESVNRGPSSRIDARRESQGRSNDAESDGELDDYWGQYSAVGSDAGDSVVERDMAEPVIKDGSPTDDYYARYGTEVETAIVSSAVPEAAAIAPSETSAGQEHDTGSLLPDIVYHAETSLRALRVLCSAAGLEEGQFRAIFEKVLSEGAM